MAIKKRSVKNRPANAAITIISKNYFSLAKTLAESYLEHHPGHEFIIILADKRDGLIPDTLSCGAHVLEIAQIGIPDFERFIYRYSIMELNTAVKPFALSYCFVNGGFETLLYIDPDIYVFGHLDDVYDSFRDANVLLIPHIKRPYFDSQFPNDLEILQSGTYNLGFIGLKRGKSAEQLLDWWKSKLYSECVVDLARGLFVDQKWIDLIPGFFPDHKIIYRAGYNVAYWNLHERHLTNRSGVWLVNDEPLAFFHFSGFSPLAPHKLSKHQSRHVPAYDINLAALLEFYASKLLENGFIESSTWSYAYKKLPNGTGMPLAIVRDVMQWAIRRKISTPLPLTDPEKFCRFLMATNVIPDHPSSTPLIYFLLKRRPDVAAAYPNALSDPNDIGLLEWIINSGVKEEGLGDIISFVPDNNSANLVGEIFEKLAAAYREDVFVEFASMWQKDDVFQKFVTWVGTYGVVELGLTVEHAIRLRRAKEGINKIINLYFQRPDLQDAFRLPEDIKRFEDWLALNRYENDLLLEEIALFGYYVNNERPLIEKLRFLYSNGIDGKSVVPSIFAVDARKREVGLSTSSASLVDWLLSEHEIPPYDQARAVMPETAVAKEQFSRLTVGGVDDRKNYDFITKIKEEYARRVNGVVNVAGFFDASSGMGESGRSMKKIVALTGREASFVSLPSTRIVNSSFRSPVYFGWPKSAADLSITVANADTSKWAASFLPGNFRAKKNIGYWVWEAENFPKKFVESCELYDEIWAPSNYAANAIAKAIEKDVKVVPHVLDTEAIDRADAKRAKFNLPKDGYLIGFIFDPLSVLERKNVSGLIDAFNRAFAKSDKCYLVLKVNSVSACSYEYASLLSKASMNDKIIVKDGSLSRADVYEFIKSLDAYASLHRSEGFGLTCAEAMYANVPVIASGYSGNLDFMNSENSCLVTTTRIITDRAFGAYPAGTIWGEPDLDEAVHFMRALRDPELRKSYGSAGRKSVSESLSVKTVAKIFESNFRRLNCSD